MRELYAGFAEKPIHIVAALPEHRVFCVESSPRDQVVALEVTAGTNISPVRQLRVCANAVHPLFAKGIVKNRTVVSARACARARAKVNAVGGYGNFRMLSFWRAEKVEGFIAFLGRGGLAIEPYHCAIAPLTVGGHQDAIGSRLDICIFAHPMHAVVAYGQRCSVHPSGMVI